MQSDSGYRIVKLANGAHSVHSVEHHETFHPVIGPVAEAEALYVRQLRVRERMQMHVGEFVVWDVGLGAAANALTFLRAGDGSNAPVHLLSFDHTLKPLTFALRNTRCLPYLADYEEQLKELISKGSVTFSEAGRQIHWEVHVADFPSLLKLRSAENLPKPHIIMFDAFSPATNPAMWTLPLFSRLHELLDPQHPCALPTYSRSTMLRVTLLLAGFWVGVGHATGEKEETTIAANSPEFIQEPLNRRWLERAHRSTSAEPLHEPVYRQAPLSCETWEQLRRHPQFA